MQQAFEKLSFNFFVIYTGIDIHRRKETLTLAHELFFNVLQYKERKSGVSFLPVYARGEMGRGRLV
jgi:hypothetical protein